MFSTRSVGVSLRFSSISVSSTPEGTTSKIRSYQVFSRGGGGEVLIAPEDIIKAGREVW